MEKKRKNKALDKSNDARSKKKIYAKTRALDPEIAHKKKLTLELNLHFSHRNFSILVVCELGMVLFP